MRSLAPLLAGPVLVVLVACGSQPADPKPSAPTGTVTAERLADYQKVAACMKEQGVTVPTPTVGKQFDESVMNRLFAEDRPKWEAILTKCDYKRIVIGVG